MASINRHEVTPVVAPVYEYTLSLTQREAEVLRFVVGKIAGPVSGPRGVLDGIWTALAEAGIPSAADAIFVGYEGRYLDSNSK